MEQQRSMMLSRAMSQRSVVIRPATQSTGGMMQYLLTIVFLLVAFWLVVGGILLYIKSTGKKDKPPEADTCVPPSDMNRNLIPGVKIYCSVMVDQVVREEMFLQLPKGVCETFVALGMVSTEGKISEKKAVHVERLRAIDNGYAYVAVDYGVLLNKKDEFVASLTQFMGQKPELGLRGFTGVEVRGVPFGDYQSTTKMTALQSILTEVGNVPVPPPANMRLIVTVAVPNNFPSTIAEATALQGVEQVVMWAHHVPSNSSPVVQRPNDDSRINSINSALSKWSSTRCLSVALGGYQFKGAKPTLHNQATSFDHMSYCKAKELSKKDGKGALEVTTATYYLAFDSPDRLKRKVTLIKANKCIYVDHIERDDARCSCSDIDPTPFPLLSKVYETWK